MTDAQIARLEARVTELEHQLDGSAHSKQLDMDHMHLDTDWLILTSTIVFLMQLGFAMLEAGMCRENNVRPTCSLHVVWEGNSPRLPPPLCHRGDRRWGGDHGR